jgi:hypothetical protein
MKMISSPKARIIIFWSPLGFIVIQALPPKVTFTSELLIDAILPHIVAAKPAGDPGRRSEQLPHDGSKWNGEVDQTASE